MVVCEKESSKKLDCGSRSPCLAETQKGTDEKWELSLATKK